LNRENFLKFAQNLNKKQLINSSVKKNTEKKLFSVATGGPQPTSALCRGY
jgi:hypothetical protein